jgi:flagellar hook protein FlgE
MINSASSSSAAASSGGLLEIGTAGLKDSLRRAEQAASDIASIGVPRASQPKDAVEPANATVDLSEAAVELIVAENQAKASAQLIETADDLLGTIIDTIA